MNGTDYRSIDKVVGIILAVFSLCGTLCGGIMVVAGTTAASYFGSQAASNPETKGSLLPAALVGGGAAVVGLIIFGCYMLNVLGAIGVMQSRRWGFILTAIFTGINAMAALSGTTLFLDILPTAAACIYCILRLSGNLGKAPD